MLLLLPLVVELAEVEVEASDGCFKYGFTMDEAAGRLDMTNANVLRSQTRGQCVTMIVVVANGISNDVRRNCKSVEQNES